MLRTLMNGKIHRATVTQADLHYVGSVTVDEDLLERLNPALQLGRLPLLGRQCSVQH